MSTTTAVDRLPALCLRGRRVAELVGLVALVVATGLAWPASSCETWQRAEPLDVGMDLEDVQQYGGLWVAVGLGGTILTSPDGDAWTRRDSGVWQDLFHVAGGPPGWVAVGEDGLVLTSSDGVTWAPGGAVPMDVVNEVVWGGAHFVAAGKVEISGVVAVSADGSSWSVEAQLGEYAHFNDVTRIGGTLVGVGDDSDRTLVATSSDGSTWQRTAYDAPRRFSRVAGDGRMLVSVDTNGSMLRSSDWGDSWSLVLYPDEVYWDVVWTGSEFAAVSPFSCTKLSTPLRLCSTLITSSDGQTWSETGVELDYVRAGSAAGGLAVFLSDWGGIQTWSAGGGVVSAEEGQITAAEAVACSGLVCAAVGFDGFIPTTSDGQSWDWQRLPGEEVFEDVVWVHPWPGGEPDEGRFLAVGWRPDPVRAVVATSPDGLTWDSREISPEHGLELTGVVWTGAQVVVVGENRETSRFESLTSDDAESWAHHHTDIGTYPAKIDFDGDGFVAVTGERILASADGALWDDVTPPMDAGLWYIPRDVASSGGEFAVVGEVGLPHAPDYVWFGHLMTSTDGRSWNLVEDRLGINPSAVASVDGRHVAVGGPVDGWTNLGLEGDIVSFAADGTLWWPDTSQLPDAMFDGVAPLGDVLVAVDDHGRNAFASAEASAVTPTISGPAEACPGTEVTLETDVGHTSYTWLERDQTPQWIELAGPSTGTAVVVPDGAVALYRVTVGDGSGCGATSPVHEITTLPAPEVSITGNTLLCEGDSTTLTATAGLDSYLWSTGETAQSIVVSPAETTEYTVTVTSSGVTCAGSATRRVHVDPLAEPVIDGPIWICAGTTVTLDAGAGYQAYDWSTGDFTETISVTPSTTTAYTVTVLGEQVCEGTSPEHVVHVSPCESFVFADGFETNDLTGW